MNKSEFIAFIADRHNITQVKAKEIVDTFSDSVTEALGSGKDVSIIGFGNFKVSRVAAKEGRNPRTGEPIQVPAYNQVKFKVGQKLKDACNK